MLPAVGGLQQVPRPDPIARDYILLALHLDQHLPGLVDSYIGPRELKAQAEIGQLPPPPRLAEEAGTLRDRLGDEVSDDRRRRWLDRHLRALQTHALLLAGEPLDYREQVRRCLDAEPVPEPAQAYADARRALEGLLPGSGDVRSRLAAWEERFVLPVGRLRGAVDWLLPRLCEAAAACYPIPPGESVEVRLVQNQPWSGYNWYDGGLHSRIDINIDLPVRASHLLGVLAHETYEGHHLEQVSKEQRLLQERGYLEASVMLLAAPESYVSEGLAELGPRLVLRDEERRDLLVGIYRQGGLTAGAEEAERQLAVTTALGRIAGASADAALLLHGQDLPRDEVQRFLEVSGLQTAERAAKSLEFIEHRLTRIHVFSYAGGERLLGAWCQAAGSREGARARFGRLLTEQLTPSGIAEELGRGATTETVD